MMEPKYPKFEALSILMREARSEHTSNAAAQRCVKAAKVLGLEDNEIIALMCWLDYCKEDGTPYLAEIKRVWP